MRRAEFFIEAIGKEELGDHELFAIQRDAKVNVNSAPWVPTRVAGVEERLAVGVGFLVATEVEERFCIGIVAVTEGATWSDTGVHPSSLSVPDLDLGVFDRLAIARCHNAYRKADGESCEALTDVFSGWRLRGAWALGHFTKEGTDTELSHEWIGVAVFGGHRCGATCSPIQGWIALVTTGFSTLVTIGREIAARDQGAGPHGLKYQSPACCIVLWIRLSHRIKNANGFLRKPCREIQRATMEC